MTTILGEYHITIPTNEFGHTQRSKKRPWCALEICVVARQLRMGRARPTRFASHRASTSMDMT